MAMRACRLRLAVLLLAVLGFFSGLLGTNPTHAQSTPDQLIFGPKQYLRTSGAPNQYTDTFTVPSSIGAPFLLHIVNGDATGGHRISSAWVTLNGVQIAGPSDFGQQVGVVDRTVTLSPTNTLTVKVASTPGAYLTISVLGTKILPTPTALTPNPLTITVGASGTLTATLSPTPTADGSLSASSANTGVATVPASISFTSGQSSVPVPVTAVGTGSAVITVSLNGGSAASTVQVTPQPPTVTSLTPPTLTITQGGSGTLTVTISSAQPTDTSVALSSTASGIAAVPATVTIPAGQTTAPITVSANTPGTAQITASLNATSATSTVTVTPALPTVVSLLPPTNPVTIGATTTLTVTISASQPVDTDVAVSASPAGIVTVPATVTVPANQTSAPLLVGTTALGQVMVTASLNGSSASASVQVLPPAPALVSLTPSPLTVVVNATGTLTVTLNAAQLTNTTVTLSVDQATVLQVPASVTVPANQTQASFTVTGLAVGDAIVTATLGSSTQQATVHVIPPPPTIISLLPSAVSVQQGATGSLTLTINAAQLADTTIPLTNSAPTVLQAPASVTVPAGLTSVTFPMTGLIPGSATVTALINSTSASSTVQVTQPPTVVTGLTPPTVTVPKGTPAVLHVAVSPAPIQPQTVSLTSSNTAVATVPATVPVPAGALGADFPVMSVGVGSATITATLNGSAASVVVVTPAELVTLTLSPQTPSVYVGQTEPFMATGTFTDGTTQDVTTSVTWTSSTQGVATINASGVASALAAGSTTITAASGSISANTTLTVLTPPALSLTPATASLGVGSSLTLTVTSAVPSDAGGLTVTVTQSGAGSVSLPGTVLIPEAQSSATVTATGVTAGSVTVTASAPIRLPATSTLTVTNPTPAITTLIPSQVLAGGGPFALIVNGSNFVSTSTVTVDGQTLTPTSVSATSLTVTVPTQAIALAHLAQVLVVNLAPGGGTSNAAVLTVNNPVPAIGTISPTQVVTGGADFTLTVNGTNFVTTSTVTVDSQTLTPTSLSATQLTVTVPAAVIATTHTAQVTVTNPAPGGGTSNTVNLLVNTPPVANAGAARTATVGKAATLDGRKSADADAGDLLTFAWSLLSAPAGSTATVVNPTSVRPTFTPDVAGAYQLQLIVNDGKTNGAPATVTVTAFTPNAPPNADAGTNQTAVVGQAVTLDGRQSSDPDDDRLTYSWTILSAPAGSVATLSNATSVLATFTPDVAGTYQLQLVVNDGTANSAPATVTITAATGNVTPLANAGKDRNVLTGAAVTLSGSASRDPNTDPLTYRWFFVEIPAGSAATLTNATSATPTFTPDVSGEYLVRLVVNDGTVDSAPATVLIRAATPNPGPNASAGADQLVLQTDTVTLDGTGSSDPNGDTLTYQWLIISTPAGSTAALSSATVAQPTFVADRAGAYVVRLMVSDGVSTSQADVVVVRAQALTALAVAPVNPTVPVGQSQPFIATGIFADGSLKDLTSKVIWSSSDPTVATISATGVATALKAGTTLITAALGTIVSPAQLLTVPVPVPTITGFTPTEGPVGTTVTITGTYFDAAVPSNNAVKFNGTPAIVSAVTPTTITTTVPQSATTGPITVTTTFGTATSATPFTVTPRQDFTLGAVPAQATVLQGGQTSYVLNVTGLGTFTGLVSLSVTGLPTGVTAQLSSPSLTAGQTTILVLTTKTTTPVGAASLTLTGIAQLDNGPRTQTVPLVLTVQNGAGRTAISGQMITVDGVPIPNVQLMLVGTSLTTTSDAGGNFLIADAPAGAQQLMIDANAAVAGYPIYKTDVTLTAGQTTVLLPFRIVPPPPAERFTPISNATADQPITDPRFPGFALTLPAGATITGWDGVVKTRVAIEKLTPDRLPVPPMVPMGEITRSFYQIFFGTPIGGVPSVPLPVAAPNDLDLNPGEQAQLWYYDASPMGGPAGWKLAGMGTVSSDGSRIVSNPGVGITRFCGVCGLTCYVSEKERDVNHKKGGASGGDPVDLATGQVVVEKTDLVLPGRLPVTIGRSYHPVDPFKQIPGFPEPLGPGWALSVDTVLVPITGDLFRLILPGNARMDLTRQPDNTYRNTGDPFLLGAVLSTLPGGGHQLRFKDGTVWQFQTLFFGVDFLVAQVDRNGNTVTITRNGAGNVTQVIDTVGRILQFSYAGSLLTQILDPIGRIIAYSYDGSGRLATVTDPNDGMTTYTYDSAGRMLTVTDARNNQYLQNYYGTSGRVLRQVLADGGEYRFRYGLDGSTVTGAGCPGPTCPTEESWENFQAGYAVTSGTVVQTTVVDPRGNSTISRPNNVAFPIEQTDAQGQTTKQTRDGNNLVTATTDPLGRKTSFTYDAVGNTTSITDPAGNITRFEYEPTFNRVTKITDALNQVTTFTYDVKGNLLTTTDPLNHTTTIAYNTFGQPISVQGPIASEPPTTFAYDAQGNLITTTDPLGNATQRTYDAVSRLTQITDPRSFSTQFQYDALNRVTEIADARHGLTAFSYDPNGNLLSVTDAKGQTTIYTYDSMDRLKMRKDALNRQETYGYDQNGNLSVFTDRKNQQSTFTYDTLNRRIGASFADGSSVTFVYDSVGRLSSATDSVVGRIDFAYDNLNRLVQEITAQGSVTYAYDALGRRSTMTVNGQQPVSYGYDAASRLVQVQQGNLTVGLGYDAVGRRTSLTYPNGTNTNYSYDFASRLTNIAHNGPNGLIESLTYTYDAAGNRISLARANSAATNLPAAVQAAYDAANEQTQFASATMTYDQNGNLTNDGTNAYTFDARNRLTALSGGSSASFSYDAKGRRVSKTINGVTTQFLYSGNDIVAEFGAGGTATYLRSLSIDEPFVRQSSGSEFYHTDALGSTLALSNAAGASGVSYNYEAFGKTTTTGISSNPFQYTGRENDGTGLYYYRARYYASSLSRFLSEDPMYSPLYNAKKCRGNFTPRVSRYVEADPELSRLMAFRFYSVAGAFAINVQKLHLYTYADDNPVNRTDPSGLIASPQTPGCDVVGGNGGFFDSPCAKKCCDAHDRCYIEADDYCSAASWFRWIPPNQCTICNAIVLGCLADAYQGYLSGRKGCS